MITGTTHVAITKLDVLNAFDAIMVAERYKVGGRVTDQLPFDITEGIEDVIHTRHDGWRQDLKADRYEDLPEAVKNYLVYIEQQLSLPVTYISTGPGREELIVRS